MSDSSKTDESEGETSEPGLEDGDIPRVFRPRRALPTDVVRPTRAEVDLAALRDNVRALRNVTGQAGVYAVLKADAYGHGAKAVARTLERAGVDGISVALVEEGVELREAGIGCPVLVMGGYYGHAYRELTHFQLTPVLQSVDELRILGEEAARSGSPAKPVHLKVDTGMARLGVREADWPGFARALSETPALQFEGLMSHLASADHADPLALDEPLRLFEAATEIFSQAGQMPRVRHMANSAATLRDTRSHYDFVRAGIALFGVDPLEAGAPRATADSVRLRPVMSLKSRVVALRTLKPGDTVGYGGRFVAQRPTVIATVPVGYADGLSRAVSGRGAFLVRAQRAPIAGVVSMDMTALDVTDIAGVQVGDDVVLLGSQKFEKTEASLSALDLAGWSQTIPWEVLTNISRRVPRFYLQG